MTFRLVVASLWGPGQSPVLPFACCVIWGGGGRATDPPPKKMPPYPQNHPPPPRCPHWRPASISHFAVGGPPASGEAQAGCEISAPGSGQGGVHGLVGLGAVPAKCFAPACGLLPKCAKRQSASRPYNHPNHLPPPHCSAVRAFRTAPAQPLQRPDARRRDSGQATA